MDNPEILKKTTQYVLDMITIHIHVQIQIRQETSYKPTGGKDLHLHCLLLHIIEFLLYTNYNIWGGAEKSKYLE